MNCLICKLKLVVHAVNEEPIDYDQDGNAIEEVLGVCDDCMRSFTWKRKAVFEEFDLQWR